MQFLLMVNKNWGAITNVNIVKLHRKLLDEKLKNLFITNNNNIRPLCKI